MDCYHFSIFSDCQGIVLISAKKPSFSIHGTIMEDIQKDMSNLVCLGCDFTSRTVYAATHVIALFASNSKNIVIG